jgi:hypothetical protein
LTGQHAEQRTLAAAVWAEQSQLDSRREREGQAGKKRLAAQGFGKVLRDEQLRGLAASGDEIDTYRAHRGIASLQGLEIVCQPARFLNACGGLTGARLGTSPQPFHLAAYLVGQRFLLPGLARAEFFTLGQELAVAAHRPQVAVRITVIQLHDLIRDVFEEVAIMKPTRARF